MTDTTDKMADIHSCSYYCERPECMRRQRDELRGWMEKLNWLSGEIVDAETLRLHMGEMSPDEVRVAQAAYRFGRASAALAAHSAQGVGDGWKTMTERAREIQARHLDKHEGDVYHAMQSLCVKYGYRDDAPLFTAAPTKETP